MKKVLIIMSTLIINTSSFKGDTTLAERHLRIDSCGPTFAERHLRTRHLRTNTYGPDICGPGQILKKLNKK